MAWRYTPGERLRGRGARVSEGCDADAPDARSFFPLVRVPSWSHSFSSRTSHTRVFRVVRVGHDPRPLGFSEPRKLNCLTLIPTAEPPLGGRRRARKGRPARAKGHLARAPSLRVRRASRVAPRLPRRNRAPGSRASGAAAVARAVRALPRPSPGGPSGIPARHLFRPPRSNARARVHVRARAVRGAPARRVRVPRGRERALLVSSETASRETPRDPAHELVHAPARGQPARDRGRRPRHPRDGHPAPERRRRLAERGAVRSLEIRRRQRERPGRVPRLARARGEPPGIRLRREQARAARLRRAPRVRRGGSLRRRGGLRRLGRRGE